MCTEVIIGDLETDRCGELANALGCSLKDLVVPAEIEDDISENDCLCCVNIEATARKHGYRATQDWATGCGEWVFEKRK